MEKFNNLAKFTRFAKYKKHSIQMYSSMFICTAPTLNHSKDHTSQA